MQSIYSYILWDKMGEPDYKIHDEKPSKTDKKICDYLETLPSKEILEIITDISWFDVKENVDYYDGNFHELSQKDNDLTIHDCGVIPSIINILIATETHPDELDIIKSILQVYYKKKCSEKKK